MEQSKKGRARDFGDRAVQQLVLEIYIGVVGGIIQLVLEYCKRGNWGLRGVDSRLAGSPRWFYRLPREALVPLLEVAPELGLGSCRGDE